MEVFVVRHTSVNIEKDICYGQKEVLLNNDTFQQEVQELKNKLPNVFDAVYCSPLQRCKALAETLPYPNVFYENALMEMDFGEWEGKKWNDINQAELETWMADFVNVKPPQGENLAELYDRVSYFMNNLRKKQYQKVLLITHAGVIRCLWAYVLEIPLPNIFKIPVAYGEIFAFSLNKVSKNDWIFMKS
ncbi:alpha-ribazole phosphatase [Raineya orbicola]|jgi:alpha-ribazole phosphatase|uniref:Alpha-ribazole phosphatase n=1 Tax=Raineya orbicola TaxID=2016530 RepID=A0A2N3IG60_9BACT|nr:alpha-ribazole phosphatase [Raineya orbicola]PKQ69281.1 Alpha-ribazole phosphatase [Raineya orbicola]